jgi:hypothetical protein
VVRLLERHEKHLSALFNSFASQLDLAGNLSPRSKEAAPPRIMTFQVRGERLGPLGEHLERGVMKGRGVECRGDWPA